MSSSPVHRCFARRVRKMRSLAISLCRAAVLAVCLGAGPALALPPPPSVRLVVVGDIDGDGGTAASTRRLLEALQYLGPVPGGSLNLQFLDAASEAETCRPASGPAARACLRDLSKRLRSASGQGPVIVIEAKGEDRGGMSWSCVGSALPSDAAEPDPARLSPGRWGDDRSAEFLADRRLAQECIIRAASASGW